MFKSLLVQIGVLQFMQQLDIEGFFSFLILWSFICRQVEINKLQVRHYSEKAPLTLKTLEERIILVLSLYDKVANFSFVFLKKPSFKSAASSWGVISEYEYLCFIKKQ